MDGWLPRELMCVLPGEPVESGRVGRKDKSFCSVVFVSSSDLELGKSWEEFSSF
jgi:hypothetical protein